MPHQGPHPRGHVNLPFACNTSWPAPESERMGRALMLRARFRQVEPRILSGRMAEVGERSRIAIVDRSPIPLRNNENHVCAGSERPPRVPAGRSMLAGRWTVDKLRP